MGVLAGQGLELAHQVVVETHGEPGVDAGLDRRQEELFEAAGLGSGERLVADVAVGGTPPQVLGLDEQPHRLGRAAASELAPTLAHELLEAVHVGGRCRQVEHVAGRARHDQLFGDVGFAQTLAQPRDGGAQRDLRAVPVVVGPERVHQAVDRDNDAAVDEQAGDERARLGAADVDDLPVPDDLDGAEDADLESGAHLILDVTVLPLSAPVSPLDPRADATSRTRRT